MKSYGMCYRGEQSAQQDPFYHYDSLTKGFPAPCYDSHLPVLPHVSKVMLNTQRCSCALMLCQHKRHDTMKMPLTELNSKTNTRINTTQSDLFIFLFKSFIKTLAVFSLIRGHHQISSWH